MTTTYVDRSNSNAEVFRRANELIKNETDPAKKPREIIPFVTCYLNSRMKRLARLNKMEKEHPVRHITFGPDAKQRLVPWEPPNRRVGRPRFKRVTETIKNMWHNVSNLHAHIPQTFDNDNTHMHEAIKHNIQTEDVNPAFLFKF